MAESGALPHDLLDEEHQGHHHHGQVHPDNEDADQRANELIKDVSSIRQLMHNPFEDVRNLIKLIRV